MLHPALRHVLLNKRAPVVLLLHFDGADATTVFTDSSESSFAVTANGNAQIDTAQSVFGGASGLFDGTGDYLSINGGEAFAFGMRDFTIDYRFRTTSVASARGHFDNRPAGGSGPYVTLYQNTDDLRFHTGGADRITSAAAALAINTQYHVALTRCDFTTRLFLNGALVGSYIDFTNYLNPSDRPIIGGLSTTPGNNTAIGHLDELRVIKGAAAWVSPFVPPLSAYA